MTGGEVPQRHPLPIVPVGLRVEGRSVLVVGAGRIAARKAAAYVDNGANVIVVAPDHSVEMDRVQVAERRYRLLFWRKATLELPRLLRRYLRWFLVRIVRVKSLGGRRQEITREELKSFR